MIADRVMLVDRNQPVRVVIRQRLEENAAHHGEQRNVGADAERDDEDGDGGETRSAAESADTVAHIVQQRFEPGPAPGGARLVAHQRGIAEGAHGRVAGFLRAHAGNKILGDLALEVEAQFVIELNAGAAAAKEGLGFDKSSIEPSHDATPSNSQDS